MKNTYFSPCDFERNCPCAHLLKEYLQTLIPDGTAFNLKKGRKLDAEKYAATYDIFSPEGGYSIEIVCDMSNKENYHYSFRKMNGL